MPDPVSYKTARKTTWYDGKNARKVGDRIDSKLSTWVIKGVNDYYYGR